MKNYKNILLVFLLVILSVQLQAEGDEKNKPTKLYKTNGQPEYAKFNINNISTWIFNNGESDKNISGNSGFVYPIGTNKTSIYKSGLVWGGKINGEIRVGGSTYRTGIKPGRILEDGTSEDINLPHVRIYRVRRDYKTAELTAEAEDESKSINEIYNQYEKDWNEWPAEFGAPFEDVDNDRNYNSQTDIPGIPGADQTIWYVANDLDKEQAEFLYGSLPIGLEIQVTIWGYQNNDILSNTMFRKYILINKSGNPVDEMYVSMWSDPDVGDATDDYVGIDTTLSLAYAYNGNDYDATYGEQVPAVGFKLLQGPLVNGNNNEKGISNGRIITGKKNLDYTAFGFFVGGDPVFGDPNLGEYAEGTLEFYNLMQGKIGSIGEYFVDPNTGKIIKFCLAGDPLKKEGWIDGQLHPPGDRRIVASSGPFEMAVGDTQEIIIAQIAAVSENRFESIKLLRFFSSQVDTVYNYSTGFTLTPPEITQTYNGIDDNINFTWENSSENKIYDNFQFQGYRIYQYKSDDIILKYSGREVALFDKKDGIKEIEGVVFDTATGFPVNGILYNGKDSGINNYIEIEKDYLKNTDFIIGQKYYFGVAAYYNDINSKRNLESPAAVFSTIYKDKYSGPKLGDTLSVIKTKGIGSVTLNITIDDPAKITGHDYKIWFTTENDSTKWNITDLQTGETLLSNMNFQRDNRKYYFSENDYTFLEGLKIFINYEPEPIENIEVVSNQSGILNPSVGGAFPFAGFPSKYPTDRQQVGNGIWLFHTADNGGTFDSGSRGSYQAFLTRSLRNNNIEKFIPYDWEMRFTEQGSFALKIFQDNKVIKVPFELWCIGNKTPDDPTDDYKLIPVIFDIDEDGTFNLGSWGNSATNTNLNYEHSVSGKDDDPYTDWIYWFAPQDVTPGTSGYDKYVSSLDLVNLNEGSYTYNQTEILARTVLVNLNGGSSPPFNQDLPETGTIFRITSGKYIKAGEDEYEFSTTSIEKHLQNISTTNKFLLSQNFPNPFNSTTRIKYKIPLENVFGVKNIPVKLIVYDILGREVTKLINQEQPPGEYEVLFNTSNLASGVYIYLFHAGDFSEVKKMVLLK